METGSSCKLSPRMCLAGVCGGGQTEVQSGLSVSVAQVLAQPGSAPEQQASVPVSLIRGTAQARPGPGDAAPTAGTRTLPLPPGFWFYLCRPSATPGQPPVGLRSCPHKPRELGCPAEAAARGGQGLSHGRTTRPFSPPGPARPGLMRQPWHWASCWGAPAGNRDEADVQAGAHHRDNFCPPGRR